jgi:ABC-type sugar transport system substrate-binding protein
MVSVVRRAAALGDTFMRFSGPFFIEVSFVLIVLTLGVAQAQKKEIKIGFSIEAMKGERWQTDLDEFQQRAHELGGAVVTRSANGDDDLQFRQINDLLKSGIDVLVFLPHDTSKAGRIVEAAHAKHVPVISYDRLANAAVDLYVDSTSSRSDSSRRKVWWIARPKAIICCWEAHRSTPIRKSFAQDR